MRSVIIDWYTTIKERYTTGHTTRHISPQTLGEPSPGCPKSRILSTASAATFFRIMVKNFITQVNTTHNPFSRKPGIIWMSKVDRTFFL